MLRQEAHLASIVYHLLQSSILIVSESSFDEIVLFLKCFIVLSISQEFLLMIPIRFGLRSSAPTFCHTVILWRHLNRGTITSIHTMPQVTLSILDHSLADDVMALVHFPVRSVDGSHG